ncbi:MAG: ATP-binding protein [Nannocystaceae bacterium]
MVDAPQDDVKDGARPETDPSFPALRFRYSIPARVALLVLVVMLATWGSAVVMVGQVRGLSANYDLLTVVYVPFQERLTRAHVQAARIRAQLSRENFDHLRAGYLLNFVEALERRTSLVEKAREPVEQALAHPERVGGQVHLETLRDLSTDLADLERLVKEDAEDDPLGEAKERLEDLDGGHEEGVAAPSPSRRSDMVRRQNAIEQRFRALEARGLKAVLEQRDEVAHARQRAEQLVLIVALSCAALALLATVGVIWTMRPLRILSERVRRLGSGDWGQRIELFASRECDDEVSRLAREFNSMAAALEERERRLIRGERLAAVGQLASQITHEIRNPLSSVALNAELLEDEIAAASPEAGRLLGGIVDEVDRLTSITEDYLRLARRPKPEAVPLDLGDELRDLQIFLASEYERAGVRFECHLPSDAVWVRGDANQLRQVFMNLLRNAQEAVVERAAAEDAPTLRPPQVVVTLTCETNQARVVVEDNGGGIPLPKGEWEGVFEAFFTRKPHGTGLGLPMVQEIVQDHGGRVCVADSGSAGTVFEVRLPACADPHGRASPECDR